MSEFKVGDKVRIRNNGKFNGCIGIVSEIETEASLENGLDCSEYIVDVNTNYGLRNLCMSEKELLFIQNNENNVFVENDNPVPTYNIEELNMLAIERKRRAIDYDVFHSVSKFRSGDVVNVEGSDIPHVIKEAVFVADVGKYEYKLNPIDSDNTISITEESSLEFLYHDKQLEEYFTESVRNGLPPWRGDLYNYMQLQEGSWPLYKNDTLPAERMSHILQEHSLYRRIEELMSIPKMKDEIVNRMNRNEDEVESNMYSIMRKIEYYNGVRSRDDLRSKKGHDLTFDIDENRLISIIGYCDKYINKKGKDHFPPYMSDYDIMKAIKEAYGNAKKVEERRHGKATVLNPEGTILFQGIYKNGLTIQFYYDYDKNCISTAYPVFVDTINRPDIRHPGNKKRQN